MTTQLGEVIIPAQTLGNPTLTAPPNSDAVILDNNCLVNGIIASGTGNGFSLNLNSPEINATLNHCIAINNTGQGWFINALNQTSRVNMTFNHCSATGNIDGWQVNAGVASAKIDLTFNACTATTNTQNGWSLETSGMSSNLNANFNNCTATTNAQNGWSLETFGSSSNLSATFDRCFATTNTQNGWNLRTVTPPSNIDAVFNQCAARENMLNGWLFFDSVNGVTASLSFIDSLAASNGGNGVRSALTSTSPLNARFVNFRASGNTGKDVDISTMSDVVIIKPLTTFLTTTLQVP